MAFPRGNVSLLLLLTLTILFVSSQAASLEKAISGRGGYVLVPFRRSAAEGPVALSGNSINNSSFVLASERTERRDPLNDFKDYTGGWNISNRHYWASVGFTAAPLFGIALTWFVVFGLVLIISGLCYCCCHRPIHPYSYSAYVVSLTLLILFTLAAVIGCVLLYYGQQKFHNSSSDTLDYVVSQANFTVENLREFSGNLSEAKRIKVTNLLIPGDIQNRIDDIVNKVNTSANDLDRRASKNSKNIRDVLNTVRLILIIVAAVMLLLAFLGFILSILGLQFLVYIAVGDTCVAMDEWVSHPKEHTALDDILPCVNAATANQSLYSSRQVTYKLADMVNNVINGVSNPTNPSISFNQSGPLMPTLCNPFNQDLSNRSCAAGEVVLTNASHVWRKYECNVTIVNGAEICKTVGRVTPTLYDQMKTAVSVAYALYHISPFLVQLEDCSFAREAFRSVSHDDCPSLRKYTNLVFIGLTLVLTVVMLSIIFWVVYARERRHRLYNKQHIFYEGRDPVAGKP
ncbi:hypothetical protein KFK09_022999 [Dendrobium nobile]|uniref:Transmembrane protein n=1 Tax=Dendrobium nobile TaxID=94219 RepID=A0A8T3ARF1_DENNO|nr:hypothetical protein KFK09_022999 [Dendrobium nobile]